MSLATTTPIEKSSDSSASLSISCTHCGLPVPAGLIKEDCSEQFCCGGCTVAYQLIHGSGLDSYYEMAERDGLQLPRKEARQEQFEEFDQPSFARKFIKPCAAGMLETTLLLDGIHCAACIWLLEKLPQIQPGVTSVQLNWAKQTARIRWRADEVSLSKIAHTLSQLGYHPHPIRANQNELRRQAENRRHLIRIGIAGAAAGNNMLVAAALYLGMFSHMGGGVTTMLRIASCLIGMIALLGPGRVFLQGALNALRTRTPHMDLPIALALGVGSVAGLINTVLGTGEIYFDSLSVLIFLLLIGRWLQFHQQNRAADAVEMLHRLTPAKARKMIDGKIVEIFADSIEVDDVLEVRAGDLVPVDGFVSDGCGEIDESILTGESRLVTKRVGDAVLAGTQNKASRILIRATTTESDTRLSKLIELVEQTSSVKPQMVQWADRIGGYFVGIVILLAMITLLSWLATDPAVAVDRTVALLIVACPCALAMATPLAISVALGRAAKKKIIVKGGDVLQSLNRPGMIWLDKTGTITEGQMELVRWYGDTTWQPLIGEIESYSSHPVAKAIVRYIEAETDCVPFIELDEMHVWEGQGISATSLGQHFLIGNEFLMAENGVEISHPQHRIAEQIVDRGLSPCWVALNGKINAILAIGDSIRPETNSAIKQLQAGGWKVGILSGDHQQIVQQVGRRLEINEQFVLGEMQPEAKLEMVQKFQKEYPTVVMVGDGVNDSAALAAATVGIAVHGGAEASLSAAPVYLANQGLAPILDLLSISNSTRNTMRTNLGISLSYNMAGATLAFLGFINPLVAAILMPISSLTVITMSLTAGK